MRLTLVGLLLFASTALGQTLTLSVDNDTDGQIGLNRDDCDRNLSLTWTFQGSACEALSLWVTTATSCGKAPGAGDLEIDSVPANDVGSPGTVVRTIPVDELSLFTGADAAGTCETAQVEQTLRVCGFTKARDQLFNCNVEISASTPPQLRFDTKPPGKPTITEVIPRDSALAVRVDAEDDTTVRVEARPLNDGGVPGEVAGSDETTADEGTATIEGLENGVTYQLVATATDEADNTGEASDAAQGTPIKSTGFYEAYVNAGGQETGGCGATGGGIAGGAVLAALGFWLSRRKQS